MRTFRSKLWKDSEITMNYVAPQKSFSKEKRFKLYSIYWPEKATSDANKKITFVSETEETARKISKMIDEEEKNQLRQLKTNKFLKMKQKSNFQTPVKAQTTFHLRNKNKFVVTDKVNTIIRRLSCTSQRRPSNRRDKYGFRSPYNQQNQEFGNVAKETFASTMYSSKGFKTAQRIKLDLPENFYPGPGKYQIVRYLQKQQKKNVSTPKQTQQS